MISALDLSYELDQRLNKLSNQENQFIPVEDKVIALNDAQISLVLDRIGPESRNGLGLDAFKKRYEELQGLIEPFEGHVLKPALADSKLNKWVVPLKDLPNYMVYIDAFLVADKGGCKDRILYIEHDLVRHDSVANLLQRPDTKPSFEYEVTFDTISSNFLEVYSDGTFTPTEIHISYLRYPIEIDLEGWEHMDGTPSKNQDSELPYFLKGQLLTLAVKNLSEKTENIPQIQISQERIKNQE